MSALQTETAEGKKGDNRSLVLMRWITRPADTR